MNFTADQYSQIAQCYEDAASDPLVAAEKRADLAKQADWFRFLAQRQRAHESSKEPGLTAPTSLDAVRKSPRRTWRSMMPFLTTLWITGAAVYLIGTVLFTNAVNLFGTAPEKPVLEVKQPVESIPNVAPRISTAEEGNPRVMAEADTRHAISPDQPTYESPTLTMPSTPLPQQELASPAPSVPDVVKVQPTEMFTVTSAATIRSGPSPAAKKIGTATVGAELQVKEREKEWVHFLDPSSGNTGWIQSSLVAPASQSGVEGVALPKHAETPPVKPAKPKLATKKVVPAQLPPRARSRAYADLPPDEAFLPPKRRGPGVLSRRRMLRDGLMSPDFLPPG